MKRFAIVAGALVLVTAMNVRLYRDVPDPSIDYQIRTGVVFIVPSIDLCYGAEQESGSHRIDFFGGQCE